MSLHQGPISDALNEAAEKLAAGGNKNDVRSELYRRVRSGISEIIPGSQRPDVTATQGEHRQRVGEASKGKEAQAQKQVNSSLPGTEASDGGYARLRGTHKDITSLYDDAIANKAGSKHFVDYAIVTPEESSKIRNATSIDVPAGAKHTITGDKLRHIDAEHGAGERRSGQLPITRDDVEKIPDIISSYDELTYKGKNKQGHDVIQYKKRVNGHIFYLEEFRVGRNKLVSGSMWKYPSNKNESSSTLALTSETHLPRKQGPHVDEEYESDSPHTNRTIRSGNSSIINDTTSSKNVKQSSSEAIAIDNTRWSGICNPGPGMSGYVTRTSFHLQHHSLSFPRRRESRLKWYKFRDFRVGLVAQWIIC